MTLDGSPQGKTAWLSQPYFKPRRAEGPTIAGYGVTTDHGRSTLSTALRQRLADPDPCQWRRGRSTSCIADVGKAREAGPAGRRPVLIHGQTLREDQVDRLKELGILPSLFPMHTFYWGDWHRDSVLGPERAENISPTGWLRAAWHDVHVPPRCAGGDPGLDPHARRDGEPATRRATYSGPTSASSRSWR